MSANPNLLPASREERAAMAAELHDREGLNGLEIAARMGVSKSYAYELLTDPGGEKSRKRKEKYCGTCVHCGGATSYGKHGVMPSLCGACATATYWTRERIIESIQTWADEHGGIPPRSLDWGNNCAVRHPDFEVGTYPHASTCHTQFGSFNAALVAAGFEPHMRRDRLRFRPEVLDGILERLARGDRAAAIANDLGISYENLVHSLNYRGIKVSQVNDGERGARIELFCDLWRAGESAEAIARAVGGIKRASVYAMAHRLRKKGIDLPLRQGGRRRTT